MEAMTFRTPATVLTDRCRLDGRGLDALLSENTRLAKRIVNTGRLKVVDLVSREGRWGWDGACLETVSGIAHDPIGTAGGMNLYAYVDENPATLTDPRGLAPGAPGLFAVTGDAAGPYVRFDITKGTWPIWSPYNNQNILHRPWHEESYSKTYTPAHPNAISNLVATGDFCCNGNFTGGTGSYGHVTAYVTNLPQGTYKISYWYHITLSSSGQGMASAMLTDAANKTILNEAVNDKGPKRPIFDSNLKSAEVQVTVGASGEARVFDYEPGATTPHGANFL